MLSRSHCNECWMQTRVFHTWRVLPSSYFYSCSCLCLYFFFLLLYVLSIYFFFFIFHNLLFLFLFLRFHLLLLLHTFCLWKCHLYQYFLLVSHWVLNQDHNIIYQTIHILYTSVYNVRNVCAFDDVENEIATAFASAYTFCFALVIVVVVVAACYNFQIKASFKWRHCKVFQFTSSVCNFVSVFFPSISSSPSLLSSSFIFAIWSFFSLFWWSFSLLLHTRHEKDFFSMHFDFAFTHTLIGVAFSFGSFIFLTFTFERFTFENENNRKNTFPFKGNRNLTNRNRNFMLFPIHIRYISQDADDEGRT